MQSLACAKHKLLTKHPKGKEVNATDEFTFNHGFKDDKYKLKINQIQQKETVEEQAKTEKQVLLDRQSHLQLVIVRILKSRKTIKHTELIMEVVNTLKERFKVDPIEIKKAIDSLIDRDYMERNGRDAYNYLVSARKDGGTGTPVPLTRQPRKRSCEVCANIALCSSCNRPRTCVSTISPRVRYDLSEKFTSPAVDPHPPCILPLNNVSSQVCLRCSSYLVCDSPAFSCSVPTNISHPPALLGRESRR